MDAISPAAKDGEATTRARVAGGKRGKNKRRRIPGFVKFLIALVVLGGIGGGVYLWRVQNSAGAAQQQTLALPVTEGDLNVTVESNGKVQATTETSVTYETTGNVVEVLVKSGDKVEAGQPLVRQTDQDQKSALTQAQASLNTAQAKLNDLKKGPSEAAVTSAKADVNSAQAALDSLLAGASKKDVDDARSDLRQAQANLAQLKSGATPKEIKDAEADLKTAQANYDKVKAGPTAQDVKNAEADLQSAQAKYDALMTPPSASDVREATSALDSARAKLAKLKAGPTTADLSTAQLAVTQAKASIQSIQTQAALDKQTKQLAMQKADRDVAQAQRDYSAIANQVLNEKGEFDISPDDRNYQTLYDQYWTAFNAMKDAQDNQTQALDQLNNVIQKEKDDVAVAQAKLDDANQQLAQVQAGATPDEIASAQHDVDSAQKTLDTLTAGPTKDEIATAQAAVVKAQNALDTLKAGPTEDQLATAQAAVVKAQTTLDELNAGTTPDKIAAAQTSVDKAQSALNELLAGTTPDKIAAAKATLAQKQSSLATLLEPATESEIAAAEQTVASAQKDVDDANAELAKTVLKAPFSGVVASVSAEPNAKVSVGGEALTIYAEGGMRLELAVNESDIQKIQPGQSSKITIEALPGQVFTGTVSQVSNVSTTSQDVVTYEVDVQFNPGDKAVKTGMSATATIVVESHAGVIQVPTRAIKTQGRNKTIEVLYGENRTPVTVSVVTGASNSQMTEITSCVDTGNQCLRAGDEVAVVINTSTTTGTNNPGPGTFGLGGGFGGGQFGGNGGQFPGRGLNR